MGNTPVPSRAVEYSSTGASGVREYKLTPEQLEEVRQKYPATARDKKFVKPIVQNTLTKGEKRMGKFTMTEAEFEAARASGKTIAKIAEEQDVAEATVYNSIKRWEAAGNKNPEHVEQKLLREKETVCATDGQQLDKAIHEIERLTTEVAAKEEVNAVLQRRLESFEEQRLKWKAQVENASKQSERANDGLAERLSNAEMERDVLQAEINRIISERDELVNEIDELHRERTGWNENERILNHLVEQLRSDLQKLQIEPQLADKPSEVQLLDRSIADLTRAKWILKRLTASGE